MFSNHLILCRPLLLFLSVFLSIRVFSSISALHFRWPKYWSFSFSISPSSEYSGLISFRIDYLISLQSRGLSRGFSSTAIQKHPFFHAQPSLWSSSHIHTWLLEKPYLWLSGPLSAKWCLVFNMLSRFVIAFLPWSKSLLISWLQSPFAVVLGLYLQLNFCPRKLLPWPFM